jgi:branched-subunit amino acid ABC-type transport system permease component
LYYLQLLTNGIVAGGVYALFAVGLTMVYSTFRFINFAHGELIAWGAYGVLLFASAPFGLPLWLAVIPAIFLVIAIALLQNHMVFAPLKNSQPITLLIASIGLSFLLRSGLQLYFGSDLHSYQTAFYESIEFGGLLVSQVQLAMLCLSILYFVILHLLLTKTLTGKSMRAVSDSMELAGIYGISTRKVSIFVWIISAVFAASGGFLLALDTSLDPMMGLTYMIKSFAAVLLGGVGNVWGALLGGLSIGIIENMGTAFISPGYKDLTAFVLIIVILLFRPQGILGSIAKGVR